jgi:hypothetical protein
MISLIDGDKVKNAVKVMPFWNYNTYPGIDTTSESTITASVIVGMTPPSVGLPYNAFDVNKGPIDGRMARVLIWGVNKDGETQLGTAKLDDQFLWPTVVGDWSKKKEVRASTYSYLLQGEYIGVRWELQLKDTRTDNSRNATFDGTDFDITSEICTCNHNAHGLVTGDRITITGVTGNTGINVTQAEVYRGTADRFMFATPGTTDGAGTGTGNANVVVTEWDATKYFGELHDMSIVTGVADIKQIMSADKVNSSLS